MQQSSETNFKLTAEKIFLRKNEQNQWKCTHASVESQP